MTGSVESPADSGANDPLETRRRPTAEIGLNPQTGHWDAVERPTPSCVIVTHAPTRAELIIKLRIETSEAGG